MKISKMNDIQKAHFFANKQLRTCRRDKPAKCLICNGYIRYGTKYYDGSFPNLAHESCVQLNLCDQEQPDIKDKNWYYFCTPTELSKILEKSLIETVCPKCSKPVEWGGMNNPPKHCPECGYQYW